MAKIKLTIQELKRQKTALKRFQRYLPTLILKKLQLQIEINRVKGLLAKKLDEEKSKLEDEKKSSQIKQKELEDAKALGITIKEYSLGWAHASLAAHPAVPLAELDLFQQGLFLERQDRRLYLLCKA